MLRNYRLMVLVAVLFAFPGFARAQIPCYGIASLGCWEIPGNNYVACGYTQCQNNACPQGTVEEGPTMEYFEETISEAEFNPWEDDGLYETFTSNNQHVSCHYSIDCDQCKTSQTSNNCHTDVSYIDDGSNIFITYSMPKLIDIQGVDFCEEMW